MLIEILSFRLAAGADEAAFRAADVRLQTTLYGQPGLLRRTTAHSEDGEWLVVVLWRSVADADAAADAPDPGEDASALMRMVDAGTVHRRRYTTLD